jgi:nucleoside-diphosphate-sugar epimerase
MSTVLVTGGSGFVGSHCIVDLLKAGHEVRTTVRNLNRENDVRAMVKKGGADAGNKLSFFAADLGHDAGWIEAIRGCDYVLHVASPFPMGSPKDENELIIPARDGALRVLRASRDAGVKRVVLTSSFAAVGYGHPTQPAPFDESSWTNIAAPHVEAYIKSKTIAEKAAWDFIAREGGALELSVINPVGIFGPALGADLSSSVNIIKMLLDGKIPACPRIFFGAVDVRDVSELHLKAMTLPAAKGQRFIAIAGECTSLPEVAQILRKNLGTAAQKVPTRTVPDWLVKMMALFNSQAKQIAPELGKIKNASNEKAKRVFDWQPRSNEECILASARSLIEMAKQ